MSSLLPPDDSCTDQHASFLPPTRFLNTFWVLQSYFSQFVHADHILTPSKCQSGLTATRYITVDMSAEDVQSQSGFEDEEGHAGGPGAPTPLSALEV